MSKYWYSKRKVALHIFSNMGHICKIWKKYGRLFATHPITNQKIGKSCNHRTVSHSKHYLKNEKQSVWILNRILGFQIIFECPSFHTMMFLILCCYYLVPLNLFLPCVKNVGKLKKILTHNTSLIHTPFTYSKLNMNEKNSKWIPVLEFSFVNL